MPPEAPPGQIDIEKIIQEVKQTFQFLISPQLQDQLIVLKIIFIVISILFFLAILYFLIKSSYLKDAVEEDLKDLSAFRGFGQRKIVRKWEKIKKRLKKGTEAQQKLSLIEGLEMLDAERLEKLTEEDISNLPAVKEAAQVCQDIARDPDYKLSREKAEEVLNIFEKALRDLQVF